MSKLKNVRWETFCQNYTNKSDKMYGNGTQSYCDAFNRNPVTKAEWHVCESNSYKLLRNAEICRRIHELLEKNGLNDEYVDTEHLFLIGQHADLKTKMTAIKEYNAVKRRTKSATTNNINITLERIILATNGSSSTRRDEDSAPRLPEVPKQLPQDTQQGSEPGSIHTEQGTVIPGGKDSWPQKGW